MLFWSAPIRTEIVHRTNAPVVPSTPMEAPRAAMRNPGFASATTKPSHHVIALRSCRSSTSAWAMSPLPSLVWAPLVPIGTGVVVRLLPCSPDSVNRRVATLRWTRAVRRDTSPCTNLYEIARTREGTNGGEDLGRRALLGTRVRLGPGLVPDRA